LRFKKEKHLSSWGGFSIGRGYFLLENGTAVIPYDPESAGDANPGTTKTLTTMPN